MTTHEYDLDQAEAVVVQRESVSETAGPRPGRWLLIILLLIGVALGSVLAAAPRGQAPATPVTATLSAFGVSLDGTTPAVRLQLTLVNPGSAAAQLSALMLTDQRFPLATTVGAGTTATVELTAHPVCPVPPTPAPDLSGYLLSAANTRLPLLLGDQLGQSGGLCALLDEVLPRGWRTPVTATRAVTEGDDLVLTVPGLVGQDLVGGLSDTHTVITPSVYLNDVLIDAELTGGTQLRLLGPASCPDRTQGDPVPMTFRMLIRDFGELESLLVIAGPQLAAWETQHC